MSHTPAQINYKLSESERCLKSCSYARCPAALSPLLSCLPSSMGIWWSISRWLFAFPLLGWRFRLQVHHLSCHTVTASRNASAISTLASAASVLPKQVVSSSQAVDRKETEELADVNMNNNSTKMISCPEPGCLFKTGYQSNMCRHKRTKHIPNQEEEKFSIPLHTSTPAVKRGRFTGGEEVDVKNSAKNSKKQRTGKEEVAGQEIKEEMEGRCEENLKWELGGVLCPNCQLKFRYNLTNFPWHSLFLIFWKIFIKNIADTLKCVIWDVARPCVLTQKFSIFLFF